MKRLLVAGTAILALVACKDTPTQPPQTGNEHRVGDFVDFNVNSQSTCSNPDTRVGRVMAISQRAIVVADTANPRGSGTFTDAEYTAFGNAFDQLVWPTVTSHFGEPQDVDKNQRVIIFFTRAVNELTPRNQDWYVGGFFFARDLFPPTNQPGFSACPASNYAEMFYMLVPDPQGTINGNVRLKDRELARTVAVIGHEFQHLINASRRLYVTRAASSNWNEETWLNEGLSHIAEELLGYASSSLAPRQNIDADRLAASPEASTAFFSYQSSNFSLLARFLQEPDTSSVIGPDGLATRGAAWSFLRYGVDRQVGSGSETAFWRGLVDTQNVGLENLRAAFGTDPLVWMHEWLVAMYTDDLVASVPTRFTNPSWNLRSIYPRLRSGNGQQVYPRYPLKVRDLAPVGETNVELRGGNAAYLQFAVAPGTSAQIRLAGSSATCQTFNLTVGETRTLTGEQAGAVCVGGGATGGEYAYIPFLASSVASERMSLRVTGSGVIPPVSTSVRSLSGAPDVAHAHADGARGMDRAREWEIELRERAADELSRLLPGGGAPAARSLSAPRQTISLNDPRLRLTIVRTR